MAETLSDLYGPFGSATNPLVAFDVVNEVVSDGTTEADGLRRSPWYNVLGETYIDDAFAFADEAFNDVYAADGADRPVALAINDYNTEQSGKRQRMHDLVERLLDRGVPVDAVGHQFHLSLSTPVGTLEEAIDAFEDLPVTQVVSELDVTVGTPVDQAKLVDQGYYYRDAFRIFRAHAGDLFSVTLWGLHDGRSWRSAQAPLLFDANLKAKPAYFGAVDGELDARLRTAFVFQGSVAARRRRDRCARVAAAAAPPVRRRQGRVPAPLGGGPPDRVRGGRRRDPRGGRRRDVRRRRRDLRLPARRHGRRPGRGRRRGGRLEGGRPPAAVRRRRSTTSWRSTSPSPTGPRRVGWNDAGATGTLTLVEPLSFTDVAETATAPVIDGETDAAWAAANTVSTDKQIEGDRRGERRRPDPVAGQHAVRAGPRHRPDPRRHRLRPVGRGLGRDLRRRGQRQERLVPLRRHADPDQLQQRHVVRRGRRGLPGQPARRAPRRSSPTATSSRRRSACSRPAAPARSTASTSR